MKRFTLLLLALLAFAPACKKKPTAQHPTKEVSVVVQDELTNKASDADSKKNIFMEDDIEQFMLKEEDAADTFAPSTDNQESKSEIVTEEVGDRKWESKRADQSKYGLGMVFFEYDVYKINKGQMPALEHNLNAIKKLLTDASKRIVIEGHSCHFAGSEAYNMMLSEKRAQEVANYLIKNGIPAERISVTGRGDKQPLVPNGDMQQQSPNRRVEFYPWIA
ncbi:MAG: OmpA family protein [candidate division TM6 bacterium GW2011_GWE2_42_60]|nr:MAG: OmpA family protein [candidate division TM6 bacterium GW2011_GWE2_42_60]HBY05806.1 hypothetical protein [Candidatus Dependentiae bacterium]